MSVTEENYASLLNHLKMTVENILVYHAHNTWNTYGDLHRLHKDVVSIIKHGFRFSKDNVRIGNGNFLKSLKNRLY